MTIKYFTVLLTIFSLSFVNNAISQHFKRGVCGVHSHHMDEMEKLYPNDEKGVQNFDRNATIHVPIQFHLVANDAGTGRIPPAFVLKQLCKLNEDFASSNMRFYLHNTFLHINDTDIYNEPGSNANAIQSKKVAKAINIFITDKANSDGALGTVLGFYSPQGDYVVLTKQEAIGLTNTLSHEVGHFFSLRHTFNGWERDPWNETKHGDTIQFRFTLDGNEIELMNKNNCTTAGDLLCDTPPDYNFGFTSNGCNFSYEVWDFNKEKISTQKNNQMSYFSNCPDFMFTPNQITRMVTNYNSTSRNYLKNNPLPGLDTVVGPPVLIKPSQGEQLNVFDGVLFDWEDVPNATHYVFEVKNPSTTEHFVVDKSEYYATNLKKNLQHTYTVTPFSFGSTCALSKSITFRTGSQSVTSVSDEVSLLKMVLFPNPSEKGQVVNLQFETPYAMDIAFTLMDVRGRVLQQDKQNFAQGKMNYLLGNEELSSGIYILNVQSEAETKSYKIYIY
jgi:hypothetical protein